MQCVKSEKFHTIKLIGFEQMIWQYYHINFIIMFQQVAIAFYKNIIINLWEESLRLCDDADEKYKK